jgi:hypothetical protein
MMNTDAPHSRSSSPATGSRECAPDDRLQRAIQYSETLMFGFEKLRRTGYSAGACHRARRRRDPVAEHDVFMCGPAD